jgi:hypothetical protein
MNSPMVPLWSIFAKLERVSDGKRSKNQEVNKPLDKTSFVPHLENLLVQAEGTSQPAPKSF